MKEQLCAIWRIFFPKRVKSTMSLWQRVKHSRTSYLMLAPYFILFTVFTIIPVFAAIGLSFTYFNMLNVPEFVGLSNYQALFLNDEIFLLAIKNTIIFAVITGPVGYMLCFVLAWFINDLPKPLRVFMTLVFYLPSLSGNMYMIWQYIFSDDQYGLVNSFLMTFMNIGIIDDPIKWFTDEKWVMFALIVVQLWLSLGAGFLAFMAGFKVVDRSIYEAGAIDGIKNRFQELIYLTLPSMKQQMLFGAVMQISSSFAVGQISIALAGFPSTNYSAHTIMTHIYDYGNVRYDMGYACAVATVLLLIMLLINNVIQSVLVEKD
ncbi:MAG: sugar ABC transporter permease [Lachnospiraceae bacterium]|nr:sugar ABC transporter permease [Lachnospiraceae bacterium]MCM1231973.1 sugar ABC transporter permease [Ruminococcus flavefaciens]